MACACLLLRTTLRRTELLGDALDGVELTQEFAAAQTDGNKLGQQLEHVAALIKARAEDHIESERDFFFVVIGGFDTHSDVSTTLTANLDYIDEAIDSFAQEMRAQGAWGNVTLVTASDFGRTLTSNGAGTDAASSSARHADARRGVPPPSAKMSSAAAKPPPHKNGAAHLARRAQRPP